MFTLQTKNEIQVTQMKYTFYKTYYMVYKMNINVLENKEYEPNAECIKYIRKIHVLPGQRSVKQWGIFY